MLRRLLGLENEDDGQIELPDENMYKVLHLLKNRRRVLMTRYVYEELGTTGKESLKEITNIIACIEHDKTPMELNSQERKRVYVGAYQCHQPKLEEHGVIVYNDNDRGYIKAGENIKEYYNVTSVLRLEEGIDWGAIRRGEAPMQQNDESKEESEAAVQEA